MRDHDVEVDIRRVFAHDLLPSSVDGIDGLVVMGGPLSAYLDDGFPSRRAELRLIEGAVDAGVPTLGVCLGAQLLALATGGEVFAGAAGAEVGWAPIFLTGAAAVDPLFAGVASPLEVLHWHGDTFRLPPGAVLLASSRLYDHQAFRLGGVAWGLQFHIEVDERAVTAFVDAFGDEAPDPAAIATGATLAWPTLAPCRDTVLSRFAVFVTAHARRRPTTTAS